MKLNQYRLLTKTELELYKRVAYNMKVPRKTKKRIQNDWLFCYLMQDDPKYAEKAKQKLIPIHHTGIYK